MDWINISRDEISLEKQQIQYTVFNHKRNEDVEELKLEPAADEKLRKYKSNWQRHVISMNNKRMTKHNAEI